jgi:7-carboxy-7-deazaguanine synthase (Cx14CxxC type)
MSYAVKELFLTLQGEGGQAGRAAVFCRFAGCNLWSGREQDRATAACTFCDTDFVGLDGPGGGRFEAEDLAEAAAALWRGEEARLVVFTGGEPLLQLDAALIAAFKARGFEIALETNGTLPAPAGVDWVCVSPKAANPVVQTSGQELKLVFPQADAPPERSTASTSSASTCSRWTGRIRRPTRRRPSPTAWSTRSGASACKRISTSASPDGPAVDQRP